MHKCSFTNINTTIAGSSTLFKSQYIYRHFYYVLRAICPETPVSTASRSKHGIANLQHGVENRNCFQRSTSSEHVFLSYIDAIIEYYFLQQHTLLKYGAEKMADRRGEFHNHHIPWDNPLFDHCQRYNVQKHHDK